MAENETALWVGPHYHDARLRGVKLLIVAPTTPDRANGNRFARVGIGLEAERTEAYIDGSLKHRQFTDLARAVLGWAVPRSDCESFWNAVALANPNREESLASQIDSWLHELEPHALLLVGEEELPADLHAKLDGVLVARIPHPGLPAFSFRDHLDATAPIRDAFSD